MASERSGGILHFEIKAMIYRNGFGNAVRSREYGVESIVTVKNLGWRNKIFASNVLMLILLQIEINSITINENICQQQPRIARM